MVHSVLRFSQGLRLGNVHIQERAYQPVSACKFIFSSGHDSQQPQRPLSYVFSSLRGEMQSALRLLVFAPAWVKPGSVMSQSKVSECWQPNMFLCNLTLLSACPPTPSSAFTATYHFHPASLLLPHLLIHEMINWMIAVEGRQRQQHVVREVLHTNGDFFPPRQTLKTFRHQWTDCISQKLTHFFFLHHKSMPGPVNK